MPVYREDAITKDIAQLRLVCDPLSLGPISMWVSGYGQASFVLATATSGSFAMNMELGNKMVERTSRVTTAPHRAERIHSGASDGIPPLPRLEPGPLILSQVKRQQPTDWR